MGSIPLLIGAVQHYKDGLGPAKAFFRYDDELNRAIRELRNLNTSFMMTLEILLKQVADESEIDAIMKNFRHQLWTSNELEASLRDVLKQAYPDYVYLLGDIESDLKVLATNIQARILHASQYRFQPLPRQTQGMLPRIVAFETSVSEEIQRIAKLPKLTDLCSVFCREARPVDCCGLGLDSNGILRGVYETSRRPTQFSGNLFNMTDLLFPSPKSKPGKSLTDVDRYLIAITVASSFLQLHTTPWLNPQWSKNEILFSETVEDSSARGGFHVDVTHPFIAQAYHCLPSNPKTQTHQPYRKTKLDQDDSTNLLDLARLLLEIKFSYGLESLQGDDHAGRNSSPQETTDPVLLTRWIKQERGNLPRAWKDAVLHCMNCSLDPDTDLQDLNVRQNILDGVVVPLVEELHYWQKGPSGGLL
ncbi:hypothetical protein FALBO_12124 [Fusarium albosuccineum]|uniref:DUF7580 domain-containing protein n=1 Tax=Fusarium albosuccineum TaxID=1237068 RepID=A0A8H4L3X9_9HYPO|nr:hypothetical protein FALBO_12124 [Fusarium albosuccineum]